MANPTVSFVIPCYNLAHLLPECVESILGQTFEDFEVLIMDDCSPDNTAEVASRFRDRRVNHIRNEVNLGHLANYNEGITRARGQYIWMMSADDYLGRKYVLERYVDLMNQHSAIGYTFCPGTAVGEQGVFGAAEWVARGKATHGERDCVLKGRTLLKKLIKGNTIVCSSVMVRRKCYREISLFPLDMPWAGDWYLWCLYALTHDVGYFAEPMVCYREHELSMTNQLWEENVAKCCEEDITIPWEIKRKADELGATGVAKSCLEAIAATYARSLVTTRYRMEEPSMSMAEFEESLSRNTVSTEELEFVRGHVLAGIGSSHYWRGDRTKAAEFYDQAIEQNPWMIDVLAKRCLISMGGIGDQVRKLFK